MLLRVLLTTSLDTLRGRLITPLARQFPLWITPGHLTASRLVLCAPVALLLLRGAYVWALIIYLLALLSDAFDGELARVRGAQGPFGARFDATVDKILHGVVFLAFLPAAPLLIGAILAADVALFVIGIAIVLRFPRADTLPHANVYGKWKLLFQALAILLLFARRVFALAVPSVVVSLVLLGAFLLALCSAGGYAQHLRAHARVGHR